MALDKSALNEIDQRVRKFLPTAKTLLEKNRQRRSSRAGEAERYLGSDFHFTPVYRDLPMDEKNSYHAFERVKVDGRSGRRCRPPGSPGAVSIQQDILFRFFPL